MAAHPTVAALAATLSSRYRITTPDQRTFSGSFVCVDPQGNFVLDHTIELAPPSTITSERGRRELGLVLIPRRHWVTVEREEQPEGLGERVCLAA